MKRTLLISMVLFVASVVMAGPITREQARQKATQFLVSQGKPAPRNMSPAKMKASNGTDINEYYVFNIGQRQGFVIVSGDDRTDAILGWADEGELTTDNMPDNLRSWLQGYADQLQWLANHPDAPAQHAPRRVATATRQPIAPLMATKWNQSNPYNYYCPEYTSGKKAATGCVCTSISQVMYHRSGGTGTTTTSAVIPKYDKNFYGYDLGSKVPATGAKDIRTFDWSLMTPTYASNADPATSPAAKEVARLMEYVGAGLKMAYGESSSAFDEAIPFMLENYFGYDDAVVVYRGSYLYEDWLNIIYNELLTNGPTVIGGYSTGGGHSFVVDGYQDEDYVHINWGWGGMSDGYFKLSVLYSDQQGIGGSTSQDGYNIKQDILLNIKPTNDGETYVPPTASAAKGNLSATLTQVTASPRVGEPVVIHVEVANSHADETYSGSLTLFNRSKSKRLAAKQVELKPGESTSFDLSFTPTESGTYKLALRTEFDDLCSGDLDVPVGDATPHGDISVTAVTIITPHAIVDGKRVNYGHSVRATLTLKETGNTIGYNAPFKVDLMKWNFPEANRGGAGSGSACQSKFIDVNLGAGMSGDYEIEFTNLSTDTYTGYGFMVYHYDQTDKYSYARPIYSAQQYNFYCDPGMTVYLADGTEETTAPGTTFVTPANALAVDVSGITGVTSITANANPNTLYFINEADEPDGLLGLNVVKGGTCANLVLTDGHDFWTPMNFTATEATFTRTFENGISEGSSDGWYTILLPFAVSQVKQGEKTLEWFKSASENGKNFWLKTFSSEESSTVYFDFAKTFEANTPYIIAVPAGDWGENWDLRNKPITFCGTNVTINAEAANATNGITYKFAGVTKDTNAGSIYQLNAAGNKFVATTDPVAPFCAYFQALGSLLGSLPHELSVVSEGSQPTAINDITPIRTESDGAWYTLDGRRVENPTKGIYIRNGKKVVIK